MGPTTEDLVRLSSGDRDALDGLFQRHYGEFRRIAHQHFSKEGFRITQQTTTVLHEAFIRLTQRTSIHVKDFRALESVFAQMVIRILCEHGRAKRAAKRGAGDQPVSLHQVTVAEDEDQATEDTIAVAEALDRLSGVAPRAADCIRLKTVSGWSREEIANHHNVSSRTISRDIRFGLTWLRAHIGEGDCDGLGED